jgi:excisionase family DNA binding protein
MNEASMNPRRFLSIEETAEYMGLSKRTLYRMVSQRRVPFTKIGRLVKFDLQQLEKWIGKQMVRPAA